MYSSWLSINEQVHRLLPWSRCPCFVNQSTDCFLRVAVKFDVLPDTHTQECFCDITIFEIAVRTRDPCCALPSLVSSLSSSTLPPVTLAVLACYTPKSNRPQFQCNSYQECGFLCLISQCSCAPISFVTCLAADSRSLEPQFQDNLSEDGTKSQWEAQEEDREKRKKSQRVGHVLGAEREREREREREERRAGGGRQGRGVEGKENKGQRKKGEEKRGGGGEGKEQQGSGDHERERGEGERGARDER
eukprot:1040609-Rhodomonas_salina.2